MDAATFLVVFHGVLLAFGLILPLGPQNVFLLTQGMQQPRIRSALPALLAAGIADSILLLSAIFGLSLLMLNYPTLQSIIVVLGILFISYLGWVNWHSSATIDSDFKAMGVSKQIVFALSVSILNPHAIVDSVGVIGPSALHYSGFERMVFAFTCVTVSWVWFSSLILLGHYLQKKFTSPKLMFFVRRTAAVVMWLSALYLAYLSFIRPMMLVQIPFTV